MAREQAYKLVFSNIDQKTITTLCNRMENSLLASYDWLLIDDAFINIHNRHIKIIISENIIYYVLNNDPMIYQTNSITPLNMITINPDKKYIFNKSYTIIIKGTTSEYLINLNILNAKWHYVFSLPEYISFEYYSIQEFFISDTVSLYIIDGKIFLRNITMDVPIKIGYYENETKPGTKIKLIELVNNITDDYGIYDFVVGNDFNYKII